MEFAPRIAKGKPAHFFWATGEAWGTADLRKGSKGWQAEIKVLHGKLNLKTVKLNGKVIPFA